MESKFTHQVKISNHPLIQHKLSLLRDKHTTCKDFRMLVDELTILLAYEATKELPLKSIEIETPIEMMNTNVLKSEHDVVFVPIMRAGIAMVNSLLMVLPNAKVGYIGLFRDEQTLQPQQYYLKLPPHSENNYFMICDPMLATGGSVVETINQLKTKGAKKIRFICILAAPEGIAKVCQAHPDVDIYTAAVDKALNHDGYITPGLGDAGDRLYGTL